jgi:hypothetical protein
MKKSTFLLAAVFMGAISLLNTTSPGKGDLLVVRSAYAQEDWKKEFDDVCSKTQDAMLLSEDELGGLVDRCDKLKPRIEELDEVQRKVYLKRLKMCRDLFEYVLKSRQKK